MKRFKLTTSFYGYSDSGLESKAESIMLAFTGNAFFPKPTPALPTLQEAIDNFSAAIAAAVDGGRIKIAERRQARKVLEDLLRALISYASMVAMGDEAMLASTGFDAYKEPEAAAEITTPKTPELKSGLNSGEVAVKLTPIKGSRSYIYGCTPDPLSESSVWEDVFDTRSRNLFTGLTPGKKYWFRITVMGKRGSRAVGQAVSYMVQ
jgi:hypothetical protein